MLNSLAGKTVLVVEDEPDVREAITWMLDVFGATVTHASNGKQALELYRQQPFDRVLTDYMMPVMKGDALAEAIKTIKPKQRVVMLSAYAKDLMKDGQLPRFVDALLSKPCNLSELSEALA